MDLSRHSVISEHIHHFNHGFDWDNTEILDFETSYNKRLISEMIHIKKQKNSINNAQMDTEMLNDSYFCLLDVLANNKFS